MRTSWRSAVVWVAWWVSCIVAAGEGKEGGDRGLTIHATWVMIWNGSTERHWWKESDYGGCKVEVGGVWQSINWNDRGHIRAYFDAMKAAGMDVIVVDFTNGFRWRWQARLLQELCARNGMKLAIAFNPQAGGSMEAGCREIWEQYAAPEVEHSGAYFHKDGKPLAVLYTWRKGYEASVAQDGEFRRKFSTVWASGEDSDKDKWGWQLEPSVGPVASDDTMFVTGSVKFNSPRTSEDEWRRHLAWLDYGFLMALRNRPRHLVVGSFDDVHERNAWMVADTAGARPSWQMRDVSGALSRDAWYRRVSDWVLRGKPQVVAGGWIGDGAWRVVAADGRVAGAADGRKPLAPVVLREQGESIDRSLWFYHLGGQEYRIIQLSAGMAFEAAEGSVRLNFDSDHAAQRWLARRVDGKFVFVNRATGEALDVEGDALVVRKPAASADGQRWALVEVATLPR